MVKTQQKMNLMIHLMILKTSRRKSKRKRMMKIFLPFLGTYSSFQRTTITQQIIKDLRSSDLTPLKVAKGGSRVVFDLQMTPSARSAINRYL